MYLISSIYIYKFHIYIRNIYILNINKRENKKKLQRGE